MVIFILIWTFLTNYDVTRVERKTAAYWGINSTVEKTAENREKTTNGDHSWTYPTYPDLVLSPPNWKVSINGKQHSKEVGISAYHSGGLQFKFFHQQKSFNHGLSLFSDLHCHGLSLDIFLFYCGLKTVSYVLFGYDEQL